MKKLTVMFIAPLLAMNLAFANDVNDGAYLDPAYKAHKHPKKSASILFANLPVKSDLDAVLKIQTPVKTQGARGTCSIFSAMAIYESTLIQLLGAPTDLDLSEEWLEYLIMRTQGSEGSGSYTNFNTLIASGSPKETTLPYIGETWEEANMVEGTLAHQRCGILSQGFDLTACLLGHYNPALLITADAELNNSASPLYEPQFAKARKEAAAMQKKVAVGAIKGGSVYLSSVTEVKKALAAGIPVTLDVDFYYGAWNHRLASEKGMDRNMVHWNKGIVGYPEQGSVDVKESLADPAGHSVVLIGYDDDMVVETQALMEDGTTQKFTYKGVYYFKNSWGKDAFGSQMEINGKPQHGYGMITQKYAEEYGTFYRFPLSAK